MTDQPTRLVPGGEPFFFPGGSTGCLLLHGFTVMPQEMLWLGEDLRQLRRDWWRQPVQKKEVEVAKGPLAERREAHYPAYPQFPTSILFEVIALQAAMHVALPQVQLPVLLMQSRQDEAVSPASMNQIYQNLGSTDKHRLWLDDFDHALVRDPKRTEIFPVIAEFVERVT